MWTIKTIAWIIALELAALAGFALSGLFDVAASSPHWPVTTFALETARDRSIEARAGRVELPGLKDPELPGLGMAHYREMCVLCHGAPGKSRREFAQGLNPIPPDLGSERIQKKTDQELYWIISHGLKMTGMPAFGSTHSPEDRAGLLVILRMMPKMTAWEYEKMPASATHHH